MISLNEFLDCVGRSSWNTFQNESNPLYITYDDNNKHDKCEEYIDKRVKIKSSNKSIYSKIIGMYGTVKRVSSNSIGVEIDGKYNSSSSYGLYWFDKNELEIIENESEDYVMEGFKNVAIVNLVEDYNKKDYAFALYDEDFKTLIEINKDNPLPHFVVVNARGKNNRVIGTVKEVIPVENYNKTKITAEVVGVVNMNNYIARENEKVRLAELAKKKDAIEKELEAEINKRKSVEYYEEMAKKYSDNPKLAELVAELKNLGA